MGYPMAAFLENGDHIEILHGPRFFSLIVTPKSVCAKSVACIIIWTILTVICSAISNYVISDMEQLTMVTIP